MSWITTLFLRFQGIWLDKWARCIPSAEILECAKRDWRIALAGFTGQEIRRGIDYARDNLDWPPSIAEFKKLCRPVIEPASKFWGEGHPSYDELQKYKRREPDKEISCTKSGELIKISPKS